MSYNNCPVYPIAGAVVADELEKMCGNNAGCTATEEWLDRVGRLRDELELCR